MSFSPPSASPLALQLRVHPDPCTTTQLSFHSIYLSTSASDAAAFRLSASASKQFHHASRNSTSPSSPFVETVTRVPPHVVSKLKKMLRNPSLETDFDRKQEHEMPADADADTFYYNAAFIAEWTMPADLWVRLPESLTTELNDWQAAGAAVCTALARIDKLDDESLYRGWPSRHNIHLSRTTSDCPAVGSLPSPITGPFEMSPFQTPIDLPALRTSFDDALSTSPETPPFTPRDSIMGDEVDEISTSFRNKVSLEHVNAMLATRVRRASESAGSPSPIMSRLSRQDSSEFAYGPDQQFDESAWDVFLRSYEAELEHLRTETLVRFRHIGKSVDRLWLDLRCEGVHPVSKETVVEFVAWWQTMKDKEHDYDKEVQMLEVPQLEVVSFQRASQGWSF
ncbi:hypothetical protein AUEXF2481DRAFT_623251 [Aureobasidium subglaciale EXF-2481]|uniref:Uncharacterized protein n=1 Tax=Aureobasidium subglaciale (strain EXF-2481) TaxID=1043005 RepID=A0A074YGU5_AURSE|nr:uncharacterized protein AUEXF2481DRAFT_623251 [Aureobasidium subglaciale EXF-2481]KEQ96950.1 hypothetical protein AUEXF2481DRAFT_623251 [Aureobasidium subglaciale EXF-2481]